MFRAAFIRITRVLAFLPLALAIDKTVRIDNMVIVAEPISEDAPYYVTIQQMDILCGHLFVNVKFECKATWESGTIGAIATTSSAGSRNVSQSDADVANSVTQSIGDAVRAFVSRSHVFPDGDLFDWSVDRAPSLKPTIAPDGTYVWVRSSAFNASACA